jgi:hypothetical protein
MTSLKKQMITAIEGVETSNSSDLACKILHSLSDAEQAFNKKAKNVAAIIGETPDVSVKEAAKQQAKQQAKPTKNSFQNK